MAVCERFLIDAEQRNGVFLVSLFQRQLQKLTVVLDQYIVRSHRTTPLSAGHSIDAEHTPLLVARTEQPGACHRGHETHDQEAQGCCALRQALSSEFVFILGQVYSR